MSKRGQVTLFIILGIALLIIGGSVVYLNSESLDPTSDLANEALKQSVPDELLPFKEYVEQCADDLLWEAVQRAGMQGGIIYPDELDLKFNYYDQTEADGLKLFEDSSFNIPYWSYMAGDNDCSDFCAKMAYPPPLDSDAPASVKNQIETYIERNFDKCLNDVKQLEEFGFDYNSISKFDSEVKFSESDVLLTIDNMFEVDVSGKKNQIRYFTAKVPIPFRQYYNDALFLAGMIDQTNFLEKATLGWISAFSGMDPDKLPPKSGSDSDYVSTNYWVTYEVKQKLKDILASNVPMFTLTTARNYHPIDEFYDSKYYAIKKQFYDDYILPAPKEFSKYNVDFAYNYWAPYLNLNDGEQFLRPESGSVDFFPWIGINRVRTMYSMSYPVLVSLEDPDDIQADGRGFVFNFAVEANIRNNAIMDEDYEPFDYSVYEDLKPKTTMFCDIDQRTSEPVSFTIMNGKTNEPEPGIAITMVCGDETCPIGITDSEGAFNDSLPPCSGGLIQLLKPNFETIFVKASPNIDESIELGEIPLEPYRILNVSMTKSRFGRIYYDEEESNSTWGLIPGDPLIMDDDETAIIQLERLEEESDFIIKDSFATIGMVENGVGFEMRLLPGTYTGQIVFIKEEEVVIPSDERCYDGGMFGGDECVMVPEEDIVLDKYSGGGAYFTNTTLPLELRKQDIDLASQINFRILYADLPGLPKFARKVEDLTVLGQIEEWSATYRNLIEPEFE